MSRSNRRAQGTGRNWTGGRKWAEAYGIGHKDSKLLDPHKHRGNQTLSSPHAKNSFR